MKKFILFLWLLCPLISHAAQLYNYESSEISKKLDEINQTYWVNIDIHVLNEESECSTRQNFSACVRTTIDDTADIIFIINTPLRRMETSIQESLNILFEKKDLLNFESSAITALQKNDYTWAITQYLWKVEQHTKNLCNTFPEKECSLSSLIKERKTQINKAKEESAQRRLEITQKIGALIFLLMWALFWWYQYKLYKRKQADRKLVKQFSNHLHHLNLMITHDTILYEKDKEALQHKINALSNDIENLLSSNHHWVHEELKNRDYVTELHQLSWEYQSILETINSSDEVAQKIEEIKNIDL